MNKTDIVKALSNAGVPDAEAVLDKVLVVLTLGLVCGEDIAIRKFGKLQLRTLSPVTRRNPRTGIPVDVPQMISVSFVPSSTLKARLNRGPR